MRHPKLKTPHLVIEERKEVAILVDSMGSAMAAPHKVKKFFGPDYTHFGCSQEYLDKLKTDTSFLADHILRDV